MERTLSENLSCENKFYLHIKDFALSLALKQRFVATR